MQEIYNAILGQIPERMPIVIMRTDITSPGRDQNQRRQTQMPACSRLARSKHALASIKQPPLIRFFLGIIRRDGCQLLVGDRRYYGIGAR